MTRWNLYFWVVQYWFVGRVSTYRKILNFFNVKSVTADVSLLSPTGGVKGINPAPHIHEHLRYTIMATALRTLSRITTSCLSTLRWMTRTPSRTRTRTTRSSEHTARRPLMHSGLTSHLWLKIASCVSSMSSMHAHLWLVSWVVCLLPCVLRFLPRLTVPLPALPDVPPQRSTRGPCQALCGTPAWGEWSHPTSSHTSQEQHRYPPSALAVRECSGNVVGVHAVSLEIMQIVTLTTRTNYLPLVQCKRDTA